VDTDARARHRPCSRDGDIDLAGIGWVREELPEVAGAAVGKDGAVTACEDGGHVLRTTRFGRVADQIDAAMKRDQIARAKTSLDGAAAEAGREHLSTCDEAVLPTGDLAENPVVRRVSHRNDGKPHPMLEAPRRRC